jgi:hypothetical protein
MKPPRFTTISHTATATNPGEIRLRRWVWIRHYPAWPLFLFLGLVASVGLLWISWHFWPLVALAVLIKLVYWKRVREHFRYGDCNPGIVLQERPLRVATATDMTTGRGFFPVLKVVQHSFRFRGAAAPKEGEIIPTVALYQGDGRPGAQHWIDFLPIPVRCATNDAETIAFARDSFTEDAISFLKALVNKSRSLKPGLHWFDPETLEAIRKPRKG